jgi:hypothetical protein
VNTTTRAHESATAIEAWNAEWNAWIALPRTNEERTAWLAAHPNPMLAVQSLSAANDCAEATFVDTGNSAAQLQVFDRDAHSLLVRSADLSRDSYVLKCKCDRLTEDFDDPANFCPRHGLDEVLISRGRPDLVGIEP